MKKTLVLLVVIAMLATMSVFAFTACSNKTDLEPISKENIKIGIITLHDENSTYDKNFIDAIKDAQRNLGLKDEQVIIKKGIEENNACYEAAADLADSGCNIIFADSFGHETFLIQAAKEFKNVQFYHATGTNAHTENLSNFHNAFASIYEGRYLAGVVAGMKLATMIEENEAVKVGYIGAHPYAEVISGYTSWFLGVRSIVPQATMEVTYTGSWYDTDAEAAAATKLISNGCKIISQHADSWGAPTACEAAGVPNVSYNGSTASKCPETFLVSSKINWTPYFELIINNAIAGKATPTDWTGTIGTGSVQLTELGKNCAEGTAAKLEEVKTALVNGTLHVFDTSKFTVDGKKLDSYKADVNSDAKFEKDTEVIKDGIFYESGKDFRSAPYFDIIIDGIVLIDKK